jgi:methionyl-tRNA formyltransferase
VLNGDKETGVTIMQMDEGMDTGDILLVARASIDEQDTAGTMFVKLAELGGVALLDALRRLKKGDLTPSKQDDALATEAPMLNKEMGRLDWQKSAAELQSWIRGLDPWPSAYSFHNEKRYRFFSPQVVSGEANEPPGTLCRVDQDGLLFAAGCDYLLVREVQPEGKKRMSVQAWLCGADPQVGARFA